jgi:hypothetical protein
LQKARDFLEDLKKGVRGRSVKGQITIPQGPVRP